DVVADRGVAPERLERRLGDDRFGAASEFSRARLSAGHQLGDPLCPRLVARARERLVDPIDDHSSPPHLLGLSTLRSIFASRSLKPSRTMVLMSRTSSASRSCT